jgi:hypothetical protein
MWIWTVIAAVLAWFPVGAAQGNRITARVSTFRT